MPSRTFCFEEKDQPKNYELRQLTNFNDLLWSLAVQLWDEGNIFGIQFREASPHPLTRWVWGGYIHMRPSVIRSVTAAR